MRETVHVHTQDIDRCRLLSGYMFTYFLKCYNIYQPKPNYQLDNSSIYKFTLYRTSLDSRFHEKAVIFCWEDNNLSQLGAYRKLPVYPFQWEMTIVIS